MVKLSSLEAKKIGDDLGVVWGVIKLEEFTIGVNTELERKTPKTAEVKVADAKLAEAKLTEDNKKVAGKIALAHLKEFPNYYTKLTQVEAETAA